jgi:hypothetical protein
MPRSKPGGPSSTQDNTSHHTSPNKHDASNVIASNPPMREVTGKPYNPKLPDHVTKHPNPVGRPKSPRY